MLKMCVLQFKHSGFSLIEMMIATLVGMMLLAGVTFIFTHTVKANTDSLKTAHLHQELRAIMDIMVQDIRRSGYWTNAICTVSANILSPATIADYCNGVAGQANPFDTVMINPDKTCILYSYDATPNGILDTAPNPNKYPDERFGFRMAEGAVEMRQAGADCTAKGWQDISDPQSITITRLQFNSGNSRIIDISTNAGRLITRQIDITLQGALKADPAVQRTVTAGVRVRNDRFCSQVNPCLGI